MSIPIVVNLFAGPGAGKSTTAAALFTLLKLHQGIKCELVTEFAKDLVWEERTKTFENQFYLFAKQQHRVWRVADKVDVVVTDSPILLSNIYGKHYNRYCSNEAFYEYVLHEFNRYNNLNFFIDRKKRYAAYGRNESADEANIVDKKIKDYLSANRIYHYPINGDLEGIKSALNTVLSSLNRKTEFEIIKL